MAQILGISSEKNKGGGSQGRGKHTIIQELSGTPNPRYFLKSIAGKNGRRTAVQIGGVLQVLFTQVVRVGSS